MKIDIFCHMSPRKYVDALNKKARASPGLHIATAMSALNDIDVRLRLMERYPDVKQVLTLSLPPVETVLSPKDATDLSKLANDEMAELVNKYPDIFLAGVATLPLNDMDAALAETDRAIKDLGLVGVQIFSNIDGEPLDAPKFRPLYEKMAKYDLPLWIHPWYMPGMTTARKSLPESIRKYYKQPFFNFVDWPFDTTLAMIYLSFSGIFEDYPNIKFITHHMGGTAPFIEGRVRNDNMRKFYADTAVRGTTGALMCGYEYFGADHLLFGTDMPLGSGLMQRSGCGRTLETIRSVERMSIPQAEKEQIFEGNAIRLLKLSV